MTIESVLSAINTCTGKEAELTWVAEDFLVDRGVKPWNQLPLWLPPESIPSHAGYLCRSNTRALESGLELRPLAETIAATQTDLANREPAADNEPGLSPAEESALLSDWEATRRLPFGPGLS